MIVDSIFKLQDKLELMAIERGPRHDLGLVRGVCRLFHPWRARSQPTMDKLFSAYLYNWVDDITEGIENWGEVGLAFAKAMWDPQSRRDLQQEVGDDVTDETGELDNADPESDRSKAEDAVGPLDVFFKELDDPDNDINTNDSYVNHYLLPMFGLPDIAGDLRHHLGIPSAAIRTSSIRWRLHCIRSPSCWITRRSSPRISPRSRSRSTSASASRPSNSSPS